MNCHSYENVKEKKEKSKAKSFYFIFLKNCHFVINLHEVYLSTYYYFDRFCLFVIIVKFFPTFNLLKQMNVWKKWGKKFICVIKRKEIESKSMCIRNICFLKKNTFISRIPQSFELIKCPPFIYTIEVSFFFFFCGYLFRNTSILHSLAIYKSEAFINVNQRLSLQICIRVFISIINHLSFFCSYFPLGVYSKRVVHKTFPNL